jgi:hypothetical protein
MKEGYRGGELRMIAAAIEFRLRALANLIADDGFLAGSVPRDEAYPAVITREMLQAGAGEPLVESADGRAGFDPVGFMHCVLKNAGNNEGA